MMGTLAVFSFGLSLVEVSVFLFVTLLFRELTKLILKWRRLPPGPWGLPFVGYLPFMKQNTVAMFQDMVKKYGPVIGLQLGSRYVVVLNDLDSITEALQSSNFTGRPEKLFNLGDHITHFAKDNGAAWLEQKKLIEPFLRQSIRSNRLPRLIESKAELLISQLSSIGEGQNVDLHKVFVVHVRNIMTERLWGKPYDGAGIISNDELEKFHFYILQQATIKPASHLLFFPRYDSFIRKFSPYLKENMRRAEQAEILLRQIIKTRLEEVQDSGPDPSCFVDYYMARMNSSNGSGILTIDNLVGNLQLLLFGGTDAVLSSLEFTFLTLAKHPEVQEKIYREVMDVCGTERVVKWSDKDRLPYTMATVYEGQRYDLIQSFSTVRSTLQDSTIKGYHIPKGTLMFSNFWAVHNDPKHWNDPQEFRPERYLTPDKNLDNKQLLLAFSSGRRGCPGKQQALMEVFILTASLIQRFKVLPSGVSAGTRVGLLRSANEPTVRFQSR